MRKHDKPQMTRFWQAYVRGEFSSLREFSAAREEEALSRDATALRAQRMSARRLRTGHTHYDTLNGLACPSFFNTDAHFVLQSFADWYNCPIPLMRFGAMLCHQFRRYDVPFYLARQFSGAYGHGLHIWTMHCLHGNDLAPDEARLVHAYGQRIIERESWRELIAWGGPEEPTLWLWLGPERQGPHFFAPVRHTTEGILARYK